MVPKGAADIPAALLEAFKRLERRLSADRASFGQFSDVKSQECARALDALRQAADAVRDRLSVQASSESANAKS